MLVDKCYNLREFKFHSLSNADVLSQFNYKARTPHLKRVCIYTHFTPDILAALTENLPKEITYLEIGNLSFNLTN